MKQFAWFFVAALFFVACNTIPTVEFSGDLAVRALVEGVLEQESPDTFFFDVGAGTYM